MTSMPSATAASIAATISGALPSRPDIGVGRDGERLVVPDVRARRDPADPRALCERVAVPGGDPGDVRPVARLLGVEGLGGVAPGRAGRRKGAGDDDLRRRVLPPGRADTRPASRTPSDRRTRCRLVDAVVDDPDLDPRAGVREVGGGKLARADRHRVGAGERPVRRRREHLADAGKAGQSWQVARREDDGDAVGDDPVAPVHRRARDAGSQRRSRSAAARHRSAVRLRRRLPRPETASGGARRPGSDRPRTRSERARMSRRAVRGLRREVRGPARASRGLRRRRPPLVGGVCAMRMKGLEPPRPYGHTDLNRARLPIPPHPRGCPAYRRPGRECPRATGCGSEAGDCRDVPRRRG